MVSFSIIKKSQLEGALRLDAEYYQPEYLKTRSLLLKPGSVLLRDIATITTGPAYSSEEIGGEFGLPLARIGDVVNKIEIDNWLKLSNKEFEKFHSKKIKNLDIILSMTGDPPDVGKCNLISVSERQVVAFNQRVAKITSKINPYYLFAYLNTEIVRLQSERNALGIRQRNLGIDDLKNTLVYVAREEDQKKIGGLIVNYLSELENSKFLYSQAESLLLEKLGLKNFTIEEDLYSVVNFSNIKSANRMDAEYFQPKYEKLISRVREQNGKLLGDLVSTKKGIEPGAEEYQEEGKLFIRVSSLSKQGIIDKDQKYLSDELYQKLRKDFEPKVGEILLTKDATPGIACVLKEPVEGIIAGGILRLKTKIDIEAEYLTLVINSIIGQAQADRDAGGSVIAHWKPEQIKDILIPVLPKPTQQKIADLVKKSHEARKKAKWLLEEAKQKVEQLIEK